MTEEQEKELKTKHKRFVRITIDGKVLAFKPLDKAKVQDLNAQLKKKPDLAVDLCINACKFVCVFGVEHFDALAAEYPLAFAGGGDQCGDGVIDVLFKMAHGEVQIEAR